MAPIVYFSSIAAIALILLIGAIFDLALWITRVETISDWLRAHPLWYIVPALMLVFFVAGLGIHLLLLKPR